MMSPVKKKRNLYLPSSSDTLKFIIPSTILSFKRHPLKNVAYNNRRSSDALRVFSNGLEFLERRTAHLWNDNDNVNSIAKQSSLLVCEVIIVMIFLF